MIMTFSIDCPLTSQKIDEIVVSENTKIESPRVVAN